jgi:hypothetical protein
LNSGESKAKSPHENKQHCVPEKGFGIRDEETCCKPAEGCQRSRLVVESKATTVLATARKPLPPASQPVSWYSDASYLVSGFGRALSSFQHEAGHHVSLVNAAIIAHCGAR